MNLIKLFLFLLCAASVNGQTITNATLPPKLITTNGKVYLSAKLVRSEPDGLVVEYSPESNCLAMAKVQFAVLPPEIQKQYGYDAIKAAEFAVAQKAAARAIADSLPTSGEQQRRDYTNTVQRRMAEGWEVSQRIAEAHERSVEAKEKVDRIIRLQELEARKKAADAAMIQATRQY